MRKLIILLAIAFTFTFTANSQEKGDWYVGTGDVANISWTAWAISPSLGYAVTEDLVVGFNVSQGVDDSNVVGDMKFDVHARYFFIEDYFAYVGVEDFDLDMVQVGVGKMFTFHKNVYVDPKVVYNVNAKTTNLTLGFGLKF